MNNLQSIFNNQPQANRLMSKLNQGQKNIIFQLIGMSEEKRAETLAQMLSQQGITKEQFENYMKSFKK